MFTNPPCREICNDEHNQTMTVRCGKYWWCTHVTIVVLVILFIKQHMISSSLCTMVQKTKLALVDRQKMSYTLVGNLR